MSDFLTKENVDRVQNERYRSNAIKYLREVVKLFGKYDHETIKIYRNGFNAESSLKIALSVLAAVDGIDLDRLRELADAERDGRVVVLPCKVGDIVFKNNSGWATYLGTQPFEITNIMISQNKSGDWTKKYRAMMLLHGKTIDAQINFLFEDLGFDVFTNEAEAERALAATEPKGDANV